MERSLPAGRDEGALVVLADGVELKHHAGQAAVDLAVVALVAKERPDARVGVRDVAALPGATDLREGAVEAERVRVVALEEARHHVRRDALALKHSAVGARVSSMMGRIVCERGGDHRDCAGGVGVEVVVLAADDFLKDADKDWVVEQVVGRPGEGVALVRRQRLR